VNTYQRYVQCDHCRVYGTDPHWYVLCDQPKDIDRPEYTVPRIENTGAYRCCPQTRAAQLLIGVCRCAGAWSELMRESQQARVIFIETVTQALYSRHQPAPRDLCACQRLIAPKLRPHDMRSSAVGVHGAAKHLSGTAWLPSGARLNFSLSTIPCRRNQQLATIQICAFERASRIASLH
jgi:hypothetical protein